MKFTDFFYLNRSDRGVILFFLCVGFVAFLLMFILGENDPDEKILATDSLETQKSSISSGISTSRQSSTTYYQQPVQPPAERFPFDPNTADSTQLLRLGLRPWQVRNIYKYRAAGGIYRRPSDFARLYGLTQKQYRELEPYIRISSDYRPAAELFANEKHAVTEYHRDTTHRYSPKLRAGETIDLNSADTTLLQRVPGIGPYFARRIAVYRQRLGGFYDARQLLEIEDFPVEALPYFSLQSGIQRLNLNRLTLGQLKRHPYINYYQAKAITDYRRLRGPLHSLNDLRLLKEFSADDLSRLNHYVTF